MVWVTDGIGGQREFPDDGSGNATRVATMLSRIDAVLDQLEAATVDTTTWNALSAANRQEAARVSIRVVCRLARMQLGRLDTDA